MCEKPIYKLSRDFTQKNLNFNSKKKKTNVNLYKYISLKKEYVNLCTVYIYISVV